MVQILLVRIGTSAHLTFGHGLQAFDHFHVFIIDDCTLRWFLTDEKLTDSRRGVNLLLACQLCDKTGLPVLHTAAMMLLLA